MGNLFKGKKHLRILKSLSVKRSDKTTFILSYMYYSDKKNKDNNQYRYEGIVVDNDELEGKIRKLEAAPTLPWKWGGAISDDFIIQYHTDTNREAANFWKARLKKALPTWEEFLQKANENPVKRYPLTEYVCQNETIDIKDKEKVASLIGKSISHVRDRAERTFDVYDPNRKFRKYKSSYKKPEEKVLAEQEKQQE